MKKMESEKRRLHCWADYRSTLEFGSEEWAETFKDGGDATCMLEVGHTGPHEWTPDNEIIISFSGTANESSG